jgi:hypothetical protein
MRAHSIVAILMLAFVTQAPDRGAGPLQPPVPTVPAHLGPPPPPRKFAALPLKDDGSVICADAFCELADIEAAFAWDGLCAAKLDRTFELFTTRRSVSKEEIAACFLAYEEACFEANPHFRPYDKKLDFDEDSSLDAAIARFKKARDGANRPTESRLADLAFEGFIRADHKVRKLERQVLEFKHRSKEWENEAALRRTEIANAPPPAAKARQSTGAARP